METYHSDVIGCFLWELQETSWRPTNGTSWIWRLGDIPLRRRWVLDLRLIWDVVETYWWDVVITFPWHVVTTCKQDVVKTYHWDVLATFNWDVVGCFIWDVPVTLLGRPERPRYDVATTSGCHWWNYWWSISLCLCSKQSKKAWMYQYLI